LPALRLSRVSNYLARRKRVGLTTGRHDDIGFCIAATSSVSTHQ
jgi:hypothetical protein